ncbi:AhpC/TSA family protein [Desulfobacterota bacterium AH_259_B03_O07]|nr:AhpC/TSA family protein [Desulfobacterota bacterium AH_259_B03_O07]
MSLQKELEERFNMVSQKVPQDILNTMLDVTRRLVESGIADNSLKVGDKVPDFNLPNAVGEEVRLKELLDKGPVILNFYRGGWCPYCNLELNAYQKRLPEINELGASLVAISPQTPDNSLSTAEKNELKFQVLSDVGNKVANQFGLVFKVPSELQEIYNNFGITLPKFNGDESWELPMPGTYVIDKDGTVSYAFADPDYTKRAEPDEVIAKLEEITTNE